MMKSLRSLIMALATCSMTMGTVSAQACGPLPNTLTNGTNADATQVMANFNAIISCLNSQAALRDYIAGLTLSTTGSSSTFGIAAGVATDATNVASMALNTALLKTTAAWSIGTSGGALDTGSIAVNSWYHAFLIERTDTGVTDVLVSLSPTAPTLPANYTLFRRIGSMRTDGSSHWLKFTQTGDQFIWDTGSMAGEISGAAIGTTPALYTLQLPVGLKLVARVRAVLFGPTSAAAVLGSPDEAMTVPAVPAGNQTFNVQAATGATASLMTVDIVTNTSAQIQGVASATTSLYENTYGWIDRRGQDN